MPDEETSQPTGEERARANGWVPQEEWTEAGNNPDDWVDHKEFNYRGELMGRISSQTKELKQLRSQTNAYEERMDKLQKALHVLGEHNKKLALGKISEQRSELRRIRAEAEAERDYDTVASVDEDLEALSKSEEELNAQDTEETRSSSPPDQQGASPEDMQIFHEWVKENPWYATNPAAYNYAELVGRTLSREGKSFRQFLDEVSETVTSVFKDSGDDTPKPTRAAALEPSANGSGATRNRGGGYAAKLTEEERDIARTFVAEGVFKNVEEYAKQLYGD